MSITKETPNKKTGLAVDGNRNRFSDTSMIYLKETHAQRLGKDTPGLKYKPSTENLLGKKINVHGYIRQPTYKLGTEKRPNIMETVKKTSHGAPIGTYTPLTAADKWQPKGGGSFGKEKLRLEFPNTVNLISMKKQ